ncbi:MAG: hypothetical protein N3E44_01380, partial [Candidatus Bathyarchaeota archaeon]|nr:hypothetical protein [Candidatus Bathyarchaeota archaeon]
VAASPILVEAAPDKYYLEAGYLLTTVKPSDPYLNVTIGGEKTFTGTWFSDTIGGVTISAGTYKFTFWMNGEVEGVSADVTFTFGYLKDGRYHPIVAGSAIRIDLDTEIKSFSIAVEKREAVVIPVGSQLYLTISIYNRHPAKSAYFYYSGTIYDTNIETPSIVVPEFPSGVFSIVPILLVLYIILKRRILKLS